MIGVAQVGELDKLWRQVLIKQTGLDPKRILNGMSIRGVDLAKRFESIRTSVNIKDCFIVFHCSSKRSDNDISMEETDDSLTSYQQYELALTIYGESSAEVSTMLKSRLESDKCRNELFEKCIYFEQVSNMDQIDEFLNETAWHRVDMSIDFSVRESFEQVDKYEDFESLPDIQVNG